MSTKADEDGANSASASSQRPSHESSLGLPQVEKLDGSSNYNTWKFMMELYLIHDDLWEYTEKTPESTDIIGTKRDQKTRAKICLMLKPHCLVHVRQAKTAKEAWEALKTFEDKGLNNRCRLLSKLVSTKLEQFSTVRDYVTEIMATAQQLRDIGKEIDDELLAALLLQGLTESFQPMRLAIENSNITLTTDYVKTKLLQMEDTFTASTSTTKTTALLTNKNTKGKYVQRNIKEKKNIKCFICDGPHKACDCPEKKNKKEALNALVYATADGRGSETEFILDSGASTHMTNKREWLNNYKSCDRIEVACADGGKLYGEGRGDIVNESNDIVVRNAMYVPGLTVNLLSVSTLVKRNKVVVFSENGCEIFKADECSVKGTVAARGIEERGVYRVKHCLQGTALASTVSSEMTLWHRRMAHLGVRNLTLLRDTMATGVSFPNCNSKLECAPCVMGKQTKQPFPKGKASRATDILELVHSDICGPMSENSFGGHRYYLTFIDDFTRKTFVYFLKNKNETFGKVKEFKRFAENQTGNKLKILRTDNGGEYVNKQMAEFMKTHGIQHQLTVQYTPEQNGVAERANRTITEKARTMLQEAELGKQYWAEAVNTAVYLKNRSPTKAVRNKTPEEAWSGRKIDLSSIRVFGCRAFMHVPHQKRTKWDSKSRELLLVGYWNDCKAYRLIDPSTKEIFKARDVIFFENQNHHSKAEEKNSEETSEAIPLVEDFNEDTGGEITRRQDFASNSQNQHEVPIVETDTGRVIVEDHQVETTDDEWLSPDEGGDQNIEIQSETVESPHAIGIPERRYPQRDRRPTQFPDFITYQAVTQEDDPMTVEEALSGTDKEKWKAAIQEELDALKKNNTWSLVKRPQRCNVVDSKWLFRIKKEAGNKRRYKARLVARGFSQRRGMDYFETFSPVVRHSSLRALIALAARMGLNIDQMDVKTAFLNGELSEVVYMKQPAGFEEKGKEDHVCLLKRSLYGLKQAPRAWNQKLNSELLKLGFKRSTNEPCVYTRSHGNSIIILAVYVDDMLIFWNNAEEMRNVKRDLMSKFEMKDLGKAELMLGIRITQNTEGIELDQESYIENVLQRFEMDECKPVATPSVPGQRLERPECEHKPDEHIPYQALIGSLMYLAVCTRPDIAHVVSYLSQFNSCYKKEHWLAAKRVLRYLKGTKTRCLKYSKNRDSLLIQAYADADHAGDYDRKSYSGFVFVCQGGAICWESKKQRTIALSTAEAEYVSISEAAKEAVFLQRFMAEVCTEAANQRAITIYSDSQSAIAIAENPVHHQRTKHIDVRYLFIREAIEAGTIHLKYLETALMVADVLTKPLLRGKFDWCVKGMGLSDYCK